MSRAEFDRLRRLAPALAATGPGIPVGVGDDAAVVTIGGTPVVVCVDAVVEGVHFTRQLSSPADVGWKALAVNVSDVAAMGGVARAAVISLARPPELPESDVEAFYDGMAEAGRRWGVALVGGDTVTAGEWSAAVTVIGDLEGRTAVTRAGARPGDVVLLAGRIGAAAAALHAGPDGDAGHLAAHRRPTALAATGPALAAAGATAMIDVSDGLGADARHVCEASDVAMDLRRPALEAAVAAGVREAVGEAWWALAVGGGEDFALLATVPPDRVDAALAAVAAAGEVSAAVLGAVVAPDGGGLVRVVGPDGSVEVIDDLGYDHG